MRKSIKVIFSFIVALILITCIAAIILAHVINPNNYKNKIEQLAYSKTGRHLTIKGNLSWSFFPWLGISVQKIAIGNPSNFKGPDLLDIDQAKLKLRLLPLLKKQIELDTIELDEAKINLITNRSGQNNWTFEKPAQANSKGPKNTTANQAEADTSIAVAGAALAIAGVDIKDSSIKLNDQKNKKTTYLKDINLSTGKIAPVSEFPVNLSLKLVRPQLPTVPATLKTNVALNTDQQTLDISNLVITLANMSMNGEFKFNQLLSTPQIAGSLSSKNTNLDTLIKSLSGKSAITGNLSFANTFSTSGKDEKTILSNLSGKGNLVITNGRFAGGRALEVIEKANAILNLNINSLFSSSKNNLGFSKMAEIHSIKQGIMSSNLSITGSQLSGSGNGKINLKNQTINYQLTVKHRGIQSSAAGASFEMPITIKGNLSNPKITPHVSRSKTEINILKDIKKLDVRNFFGQ